MKVRKNYRFIVTVSDGRAPVFLNTENQVRVYTERTVRGTHTASVYERTAVAARDAVSITPLKAFKRPKSKDSPRQYRRWSGRDDNQLIKMLQAGVSVIKISGIIGRTVPAVYSRKNKLQAKGVLV